MNVTRFPTAGVSGPKPAERALWSFLITTLAGPFIAAIIIFLSSVVAALIGRGPPTLLALDNKAAQLAWAADKALNAYVWSALPAGLCGLVLAALVYSRGTAHWLVGASLGAIVASVFAVLAGGMFQQHLTPIALIAAISGVAIIALLKKARIFAS